MRFKVNLTVTGTIEEEEGETPPTPTVRKFVPGHHFIMLRTQSSQSQMQAHIVKDGTKLVTPAVWKRFAWHLLEGAKGTYTLDEIKSDLDWAKAQGLQFIVLLETKTFKQGEYPAPDYLEKYSIKASNGDCFVALWDAYVMDRANALLTAIGNKFKDHPNFGGVACQETAMGSPSDAQLGIGSPVPADKSYVPYTIERFRDQMIRWIQHAATALPTTRFWWGANFVRGNNSGSIIRDILDATKALNSFVLWGPDILPGSKSLEDRFYPIMRDYAKDLPCCIHAQHDSYSHPDGGPFKTMVQIRDYGIDNLKANAEVWTYLASPKEPGSYDYDDAIVAMKSRPTFNVEPW